MIRLRSVYQTFGEPSPEAVDLLYLLLRERPAEASISHRALPTFDEHEAFVRSRPYREWYIITTEVFVPVGAIYATNLNEIGIAIFREHWRLGYAGEAIRTLLRTIEPLPAVPSKRRGTFIANVAPGNEVSKALFEKLGGRLIQVTYELPRGETE